MGYREITLSSDQLAKVLEFMPDPATVRDLARAVALGPPNGTTITKFQNIWDEESVQIGMLNDDWEGRGEYEGELKFVQGCDCGSAPVTTYTEGGVLICLQCKKVLHEVPVDRY